MALVGDEAALRRGLARLEDLGVSDFEASLLNVDPGAEERTLDFLASYAEETR